MYRNDATFLKEEEKKEKETKIRGKEETNRKKKIAKN